MQTVQLARSTEVYKLADKALTKALTIHSVVVPKGTLCDEMCCENKATHIAYTEHRYNCEKHSKHSALQLVIWRTNETLQQAYQNELNKLK